MPVDDLWHLSRAPVGARPCGEHGKLVPSGRHGRGMRWRVRYVDPDGNPQTQAFDKKAEADQFNTKVQAEVQRGEYIDPDAGKIKLREYAELWLERQSFDPSTREAVESRFRANVYPSIGHHELRAVAKEPSIITGWIRGRERAGLAAGTIRTIYVNLSAMLTAAMDDGRIARNPCKAPSVKKPPPTKRKVVAWAPERVAAVREGLPPRYAATTDVGAGGGLRQGETFGLAVDDIDWLRHNIHVCRQVKQIHGRLVFAPPKFGKERDVPLSDELALRLAAHLQQWPALAVTLPWLEPDGPPVTARLIFTGRERKAVNRNYYNAALWKPALVGAGVIPDREPGERYDSSRDQGFHQLRHYFASAFLANGGDIRELAEILGHEDPGFTLRVYTHLMPGNRERARAAAGSALAGPAPVPVLYRVGS